MIAPELRPFLDEDGKLKQYPAKRSKQLLALAYLAGKFESGRDYSELDVNALIGTWHTFGDVSMLRRDLFDAGFIDRKPNGSRYWKTEIAPQ